LLSIERDGDLSIVFKRDLESIRVQLDYNHQYGAILMHGGENGRACVVLKPHELKELAQEILKQIRIMEGSDV
jgi:hypothetical protein